MTVERAGVGSGKKKGKDGVVWVREEGNSWKMGGVRVRRRIML